MGEDLVVFVSGLEAGSLLFVSLVSGRTLSQFVERKNDRLLREFFPLWWPNGRDLVAPLGLIGVLLCIGCSLLNGLEWLLPGICFASIILFTITVMKEDIDTLRSTTTKAQVVFDTAKQFVFLHHFRTYTAMVGFCLSLWLRVG